MPQKFATPPSPRPIETEPRLPEFGLRAELFDRGLSLSGSSTKKRNELLAVVDSATATIEEALGQNSLPGVEITLVGTYESTVRFVGKIELAEADEIDPGLSSETAPSLVEDSPQEETAKVRFFNFLGETAVKEALQEKPKRGPASRKTLAKSIPEAKEGSEEAMARVDASVSSATSEGWFKKGHVRRTTKERNSAGEVVQFGLTTETMHRDALVLRPNRPRKLKEFTLAEAMNGFREQELVRNNELQDSWFVVVSCVPEDLPEEELDHRGDGYFTRSMTYSLQGTTQEGAQIIHEIIFDQGTDASEYASYEERQFQRSDIPAIGKVCEWLGLPAPKTALEMLQKPIKVPKHLMPNGMVDFWRWIDKAKDELRGEVVVRTEEEYSARREESRKREESIVSVGQKIKAELFALDGTCDENNDEETVEALWELVRKYGPEEAAVNDHIDPIVFGPEAAEKIVEARRFIRIGDLEAAKLWIQLAQELAVVSGCGGGRCGINALSGSKLRIAKEVLKTEPGANVEIVEDTENPCPKCGEMTVVYEFIKDDPDTPPKKGCTNPDCGVTENV